MTPTIVLITGNFSNSVKFGGKGQIPQLGSNSVARRKLWALVKQPQMCIHSFTHYVMSADSRNHSVSEMDLFTCWDNQIQVQINNWQYQ